MMAVDEIDSKSFNLNSLDKSDWKTYRFDEIAQNISERIDPNNTDLEVYIGLEHIDSESLHINRFGSPDDVNGQKLKFYKGDIIFGRRRAYQRKAVIATCDGFCSAHALVLRANPEVISPEIFPFFLHSDLFMHRAVDISVGSLSPTINWGTLKHQEFLIPPSEQKMQLAGLLWAMDEVIQKESTAFDSLDIFLKSKIRGLLSPTQKLGNNGCWVKLKDLAKFIDYRGKTPKKKNSGIRLITAKNIRDGWIDENPEEFISEEDYDPWMRRGIPRNGDVLFTTEAPLGNTSLVDFQEKFALAQRVICLQPNEKVNGGFLFYSLRNPSFRGEITSKSTGTTVSGIRAAYLKEVKIFIPSLSDQKNISKRLKQIESTKSEVGSKLQSSITLQKSLINQVF